MTYTTPWSRQKELSNRYKDEEVPDIAELNQMIETIQYGSIDIKKQTLRARALFATYYLTGCRASEITKCNMLRKQQTIKKVIIDDSGIKKVLYKLDEDKKVKIKAWKEEHDYIGIKKKDISFRKIDGRQCMLIRTENRKNKTRLTKRTPIPIEKEKLIVMHLYKYMKLLDENAVLFPFGHKRATQIINETVGFNIHFIRHIRATHLITKYDFNEQMLVNFMGWTDARPAKNYMELSQKNLFREFFKGE